MDGGPPQWLSGKESTCNAGEVGSIPGPGRSPGERNGNPLRYSCLKNPMDRGAWRATVHGVAKGRTGLHSSASRWWGWGSWKVLCSALLITKSHKLQKFFFFFLKERNILSKAGIHLFSESGKFLYRFCVCSFKISGK